MLMSAVRPVGSELELERPDLTVTIEQLTMKQAVVTDTKLENIVARRM